MTTTGQTDDTNDKRVFKTTVYFAILDAVIGEMNRRFSYTNCAIMTGIHSLSPQCSTFLKLESIKGFAELYESNVKDLEHELYQVQRLLHRKKASGCNVPTSLLNFTIFLEPYKDAFHELFRLCQVAVTIPVSSALYETSFSALKRIKSYLRNSMTDFRLSNLGILSIESECAKALNMETFVDIFASRDNNRRITLY